MLIGLPQQVEPALDRQLEDLMNDVDCDITMMRAPDDWKISEAKRVLVPIAGKSEEAELRARTLASLSREAPRELVFLCVLPAAATDDELATAMRTLTKLAAMKLPGTQVIEVVRSDDATAAILVEAARCDLVVLGMRRSRQGKKQLGSINRAIVAQAACAVMLLSTQSQLELTRPIRDVAQLVPFLPKRAE